MYFHSIVSPDVNPTENFRLPAKVDQHHQSPTLKVFLPQAISTSFWEDFSFLSDVFLARQCLLSSLYLKLLNKEIVIIQGPGYTAVSEFET